MENNRYYYIDTLKGIGIILVVLGHLNPCIYVEKWIYSFHMFLFFFLSGYVFKKKENIIKQITASAKGLLLPFVFWNGLAVVISLIIGEYTLTDGIEKLFYLDKVSWNSPVWFLFVLFWTKIFYQLLYVKKYMVVPIICLMVFCSYYGISSGIPLGVDILPNAIIFFGIGILLRDIKIQKYSHLLFIPLLIINVVGSLLNDRISVYGNYYGQYILALITGICGVLGIFMLIRLIARPNKFFNAIEKMGGV